MAGDARESVRDTARVVVEMECGIRTRLTQGAGRATRNSADYAAVLMLGQDLANFAPSPACRQPATRRSAPSCRFGLDNSTGMQSRDAMENLRHFLGQDQDWRVAEQDIIAPYMAALAGLGELAGGTVLQRTGADAEPDYLWMFGTELWVGLEAKTECDPDGDVSARTAREAGGHLNFAASSTGVKVQDGSFAVIISGTACTAPQSPSPTAGSTWCAGGGRRGG